MAHIRHIREEEARGTLKAAYEAGVKRAGKVSEILKIMSLDERVLDASMAFYLALMKTDRPLTRAQKEMLAVVVSNVNDCFY